MTHWFNVYQDSHGRKYIGMPFPYRPNLGSAVGDDIRRDLDLPPDAVVYRIKATFK
jgi:hypothetical protein